MTDLRGSCLCGAVTFEVTGPIRGIGSCHCSKCRKVSGTNGNALFIISTKKFSWTKGENNVSSFALPSGWGASRCDTCGSPVPASYNEGNHMWVQAGLMDDRLETDLKQHIFCGSRADWDKDAADAEFFEEFPPNR